MKAYDIVVGEVAVPVPGRLAPIPAGWAGPQGPALDPSNWPRSPRTGQPMHHRFTLWLPQEYRLRGDHLVAVSVFQWHDDYYWRGPAVPDSAATTHPRLHLGDDGVSEVFALLWLTMDEYSGTRTVRPAHGTFPDDGEDDPDGTLPRNASIGPVWLAERDDPNAGIPVSVFSASNAYVDLRDRFDKFGGEHLGGTCMNPDGPFRDLSPWYVEVNRLGGINHGGDEDIAFDFAAKHMLSGMSSHVR